MVLHRHWILALPMMLLSWKHSGFSLQPSLYYWIGIGPEKRGGELRYPAPPRLRPWRLLIVVAVKNNYR